MIFSYRDDLILNYDILQRNVISRMVSLNIFCYFGSFLIFLAFFIFVALIQSNLVVVSSIIGEDWTFLQLGEFCDDCLDGVHEADLKR